MSHFSDSRDPSGIGFLILQDHGYLKKDIPDHGRGSLVGVRVVGRNDDEGEYAEWEEDELARGPIGGGHFWSRKKTNAGAWRFSWPAVIAPSKTTTPSTGTGDGGSFPGAAGGVDDSGREPSDGPAAPYLVGYLAGKDPYPTLSNGEPDWQQINTDVNSGKTEGVTPTIKEYVNGVWASISYHDRVLAAIKRGVLTGGPLIARDNVFGFGSWWDPQWVGGNDPKGNPTDPSTWSGNDPKGTKGDDEGEGDAGDNASQAWFLGPDKDQVIPTDHYPVDSARLPDKRFNPEKSEAMPVGWPQFPRGYYGIVQTSSQDESQVDQWYPADPRLVAPNFDGPGTAGTPVADMGGTDSSLSLQRHAPLQSLVRVIRGPAGDSGMLKRNGEADFPRSWLARQIGPAGQWDVSGGLVVDIPTAKDGTIARKSRILAMESVTQGGPLDVGHFGDLHQIGQDADGNPINSLHLSTDALFKVRGDVFQDGPIKFQEKYPPVTRLPYPVEAHIKWHQRSGFWRLHSWGPEYRPPGTITPKDPPPREPVGDPPPDDIPPYGGGDFHDPPGPRPPGQVIPPGRRKKPRPLPPVPPGPPIIRQDQSSDRDPRWGTASTQERMGSSFTVRALPTATGEVDWRYYLEPTSKEIRDLDRTAPMTMRLEAFGAQGGELGGPYMGEQVDWQYTQRPEYSRYPGGSSPGGWVILPPEVDLADIDDTFAPGGLDLSATYLVAGPGACFAWGTPELASGGVKTGHSSCVESGDLVFYRHDSAGATTEERRFKSDGTFEINDHAAITLADGSTPQVISTTPVKITGFTTNGENSNMLRDAAADTITTVRAGTYLIPFQCSFEGDNAVVYEIHLRVNGVEQDEGCHRYLGTGQDEGSCSFVALKSLSVGDVLTVYVEANGANKDFIPIDMQLTAVRIL